MYRRLVVYSSELVSSVIKILYNGSGGKLLSQQRVFKSSFSSSLEPMTVYSGARFPGAFMLKTNASIANAASYEFIMDVDENQTSKESVSEITTTGVYIAVYNENCVLVCDNGKRSTMSAPDLGYFEHADSIKDPDEMTSVPGEELGGMN